MKKNYLIIVVAFIALVSGIFGCSKSSVNIVAPANDTAVVNVLMQASTFTPSNLNVAVNTTVKWTNKDAYLHTVTSDSVMFDSGNMAQNAVFTHKFTNKGSFKYHCSKHTHMTGTVVVE